ncbi:DNA-3-methyladenine glycosylase 2 family protein [Microterricola viridarii]|uniref:DNA-3-methyladenine glycosylase II n=1 Tax=Microterricola viridarii TaxID=412690 RepID=A0A0Y0MQU9_9MICO|nr:AlkA N-terminal domain-containing protein [Microterricola viridarii]AMB58133.1 AraC family transcriptional regulator [Microterricola viridarii]
MTQATGEQEAALFAERYRAMSSRDARFDGQFITGVHSTGIYCRPSCPATTPKAVNVSFYLTAAAAHEAGLRACKRCLPDAVPGSPEWNVRDDLAARAMRLIADGEVERSGVPGLAARLGYTPRHLGRVLQQELGAGPLALARAQRAQTARELLVNTLLPLSDIAFAAGFGSVRQFNETVVAVYQQTPSELRLRGARRRSHSPVPSAAATLSADAPMEPGTSVSLRLPARAPFDGAGVFGFLGVRAVAGVETYDGRVYRRALRLPTGTATVALSLDGTPAAPFVRCEATLDELSDLAPLVSRVRRLLDLDADAAAIDAALAADPALAPAVAAVPGIRVPGSMSPEETLFRALIGQQISVAAAHTMLGRLAAALGDRLPVERGGWTLFPTAAQIAAGGRDVLRGPVARIDTIVRVAEALAGGELRLDVGESAEQLMAQLTAMKGIGPWTAGYVAMRVLGSPDVLLTSDLAIRQGAARLGLPDAAAPLAAHGAAWAPWRSYAGMHLWRALAG